MCCRNGPLATRSRFGRQSDCVRQSDTDNDSILQDLTRLPSRQRLRWQVDKEESNIFNLCVIRPPDYMCQPFLNMSTLLALTQSVDNFFYSLVVLC